MMEKFGKMMDIDYALVNSWAMFAGTNGPQQNMIQLGGDPNIWVVSNTKK